MNEDAMQVEAIEPFRHAGEPWAVGDRRTVSRQIGEYLCRSGFCRDTSGAFPTSKPRPGERVFLDPADVRIKPIVPSA